MSLDRDPKFADVAAPIVKLGGHEFLIAPLSLRQILGMADSVPRLGGISIENLSGERLEPLCDVVWWGLRRAHPDLTRDEFFDLPVTIAELVAAMPVVLDQAGGRRKEPGEGETQATSASTLSIGASSSPNSSST